MVKWGCYSIATSAITFQTMLFTTNQFIKKNPFHIIKFAYAKNHNTLLALSVIGLGRMDFVKSFLFLFFPAGCLLARRQEARFSFCDSFYPVLLVYSVHAFFAILFEENRVDQISYKQGNWPISCRRRCHGLAGLLWRQNDGCCYRYFSCGIR